MIDKEKLTSHIKDEDTRNIVSKVLDKAASVIKNHDVKSTDFLNPYELKSVKAALNPLKMDMDYIECPGVENAERKCILMYPWYMDPGSIEIPVSLLCVSGNFKFKDVSHRDYLGSVMGLGLKREKVGDIHLHQNSCHMAVKSEIADFIKLNFKKVSTNSVDVDFINVQDFMPGEKEFKVKNFTVSSMRLDCMLSGLYNVSRSEASKIIDSQAVKVDFEPVFDVKRNVGEGALISVRRKGRAVVEKINGNTKKGRISITSKILK